MSPWNVVSKLSVANRIIVGLCLVSSINSIYYNAVVLSVALAKRSTGEIWQHLHNPDVNRVFWIMLGNHMIGQALLLWFAIVTIWRGKVMKMAGVIGVLWPVVTAYMEMVLCFTEGGMKYASLIGIVGGGSVIVLVTFMPIWVPIVFLVDHIRNANNSPPK